MYQDVLETIRLKIEYMNDDQRLYSYLHMHNIYQVCLVFSNKEWLQNVNFRQVEDI